MNNVVLDALREKEAALLKQVAEVRAAIRQYANPLNQPQWEGAKVKTASAKRSRRRHKLSAAARQLISQRMKARWAERRGEKPNGIKKAGPNHPTHAQGKGAAAAKAPASDKKVVESAA